MIVSFPNPRTGVRKTACVSSSGLIHVPRRRVLSRCADSAKEPLPSDGSVQRPSKEDLLKRIAEAKAYKDRQKSDQESSAQSSPYGDALERPEYSDRRLSNEDFQARFNRGSTESTGPGFRKGEDPPIDQEWSTQNEGSADQPASFLMEIDEVEKTIEENQRPEDFAIEEETRKRSRGAEVISVDKSYRPKVSTWGVFPRPANISKAYGGGKTIDPKQFQSEDPAKNEEFMKSLLEYKKQRGLYVDPESEKEFRKLFAEGEMFLKKGRLKLASERFESASEVVSFKTRFGGEANLKKAICLDSMGDAKEAKAIYEQLTKHPQGDIQKQAKRMLFGFKAMDYLKVEGTNKRSASLDYESYFAKIPQDWNSTFVSMEEQTEEKTLDEGLIISILVIVVPIVFIFALARH